MSTDTPWRRLYRREAKAVEWLVARKNVQLAAIYMNGPNHEPRYRVKHGRLPRFTVEKKDILDGMWAIRQFDAADIQEFVGAPQLVKNAAQRLTQPAGSTYLGTIERIRDQALVTVPAGTKDMAGFLHDWASAEHKSMLDRIGSRASSIKRAGATYYHVGRKGYPVGHVIEPYFTTKMVGILQRTEQLENAFEASRERNGAQVPRLNVAYAFENSQDAIQFAYGGGRQLYAVEALGPVERRDMVCIDEFENVIGQAKELDYVYEDATSEEWDVINNTQESILEQIIDAYWQGKHCPQIDMEDFHTSPEPPVWEIVCAQGFRVVAVEDPSTVEEARLRFVVRLMIAETSASS